ncbi:MAG: hypothetical protein A2V81_02685 [Candidatus Abawacabacteria bacterium RBG_16_42_10]|uniref:SLH domain-containing protein n=1 Tax=Candidatus Abawacabacteria bacterium RBG_16_42_10 TaxID=1817814 RepID=A0A1F4XK26_9BACT|nr:MAG: hypothetical protein A2V81_02685 [Candidatus Abawacabacteria bacterium RBG_16_42_10]
MFLIAAIAFASTQFADLPPNHSAYPAVQYLVDKGIIKGYENNMFLPDRGLTRAEALKIILLAASEPVADFGQNLTFTDIPSEHWAYAFIAYGVENSIVKGYDDNTFRPDQTITRAEGIKVLFSAFAMNPDANPSQAYSDVPPDHWFFPYASTLMKKKLWQDGSPLFEPNRVMSRQDIAKLSHQFILREEASHIPVMPLWVPFIIVMLWLITSWIGSYFWTQIFNKNRRAMLILSLLTGPISSALYGILLLIPKIKIRQSDMNVEHKNPFNILLKPRKLGVEIYNYIASKSHGLVLVSVVFLLDFLLGHLIIITYHTYLYKISFL